MLSLIDQILLTVLAGTAVAGVGVVQILKAENPSGFPRARDE